MKKYRFKKEVLRKFLRENDLSVKEFMKICHVGNTNFYKILNGNTKLIVPLHMMAAVMNVTIFDLFEPIAE